MSPVMPPVMLPVMPPAMPPVLPSAVAVCRKLLESSQSLFRLDGFECVLFSSCMTWDRSTTHPKFDPIGVRTHDLQIMAVHFMSLRRLL